MIGAVAGLFGISSLRLIVYAGAIVAVIVGALAIRQHYINLGWDKALEAVKTQNEQTRAAAEKVDRKTATCSDANGYWDVITQACKTGDVQ